MKSMLHEATTVQKAVEQAWQDAGKPSEFTIKVLDPGKKGLLWFSKQPAIISISYDPKTASKATKSQKKGSNKTNKENNRSSSRNRNRNRDKDRSRDASQRKSSGNSRSRQDSNKNRNRDNNRNNNRNRNTTQKQSSIQQGWSSNAIEHINNDLQHIVKIIDINTPFTTRSDKKTLYITFERRIHHSDDEQKLLFISLSYLLMQFLKKTFKKKFNGYQLMITTKAPLKNNDTKKNKSTK